METCTATSRGAALRRPVEFGALFGYRRNRQWHPGFAFSVCLGGMAGGLIGPFERLELVSDAEPCRWAPPGRRASRDAALARRRGAFHGPSSAKVPTWLGNREELKYRANGPGFRMHGRGGEPG